MRRTSSPILKELPGRGSTTSDESGNSVLAVYEWAVWISPDPALGDYAHGRG